MRQFPEIVSGYELEKAEWGVIIPTLIDTTNLVENPSLETNSTGFNAIAGVIERVAENSAFGSYALKCTPGVGINDGCYYEYITLENEHQYFFSVYVKGGDIGQKYRIYFADNIGGRKGAYKEFTAKSELQRIWVSWNCEYSSALFRVYIVKSGHAGIKPFYIDALQVEEQYITTYIDGDRHGFLPDRNDYYWNGIAHESTSVRIAQSRHGGREIKLKDLGFSLLAMVGVGLGGFNNRYTPLASGGDAYDGTYKVGRNFALVGAITGQNYNELRAKQSLLYSYFSPDYASPAQPVKLTYRDFSCDGNLPFSVPCVFDGGLDDELNNYNQQRVSLNFHAYLPSFAQSETEIGYELGFKDYHSNPDPAASRSTFIYRDSEGNWTTFSPSNAAGGLTIFMEYVYFGSYDGVSRLLQRYKISDGTIETVAIMTGDIYNIKTYGDYLYICGDFTAIDGNPFLRVARYDGTTFSALGTGIDNAIVRQMAFADDGTIYFGGTFQFPVGNWLICSYKDGNFSAMDGGIILDGGAQGVRDISIGGDGKIWVVGEFTTLNDGLATAIKNVTYYEDGAFADIQGVNFRIIGSCIDKDGKIYIGGLFTQNEGGTAINYIAYWNGYTWQQLGSGLPYDVYRFDITKEGIAIGWLFAPPLGREADYPSSIVIWNGSDFVPFDFETDGDYDYADYIVSSENNYIFSAAIPSITKHNFTFAKITQIENTGNFNSYPILKFTGKGMLRSLKNMSTGKYIWFDLNIQDGEIAELSTDPNNIYFKSNLRDNLLSTVLPGSNLTDFYLKPGENNISLFISGYTSANTSASLKFIPVYGSLP